VREGGPEGRSRRRVPHVRYGLRGTVEDVERVNAGPEPAHLAAHGGRQVAHRHGHPVVHAVVDEVMVEGRELAGEVSEVPLEEAVRVLGVRPRHGQVRWQQRAGRRHLGHGRVGAPVRLRHGLTPSGAASRLVTGRHCRSTGRPPSNANSTSTGCPSVRSNSMARVATCLTSPSVRLCFCLRNRGVLTSRVPASCVIVIVSLSPTVCSNTLRLSLSTTHLSGLIEPPIRLSPRPQLALTTMRLSSKATGSMLNTTPDTSQATSLWTSTATATCAAAMPLSRLYASALSARAERHTPSTAWSSPSGSRTFRCVACCPAKDAVTPSSPRAEERTATGRASVAPVPSRSRVDSVRWARTRASATSPG